MQATVSSPSEVQGQLGVRILAARGISKSFPGVKALNAVDFELAGGEVHALVGENGAGKSTLMKVMGGIYTPDTGTVSLDGEVVTISGPLDAQQRGISLIHQELNLMPDLTVAENIFIGREPRVAGSMFLTDRELNRRADTLLERLGIRLKPTTRVGTLTIASQQMVEIARAMSFDSRILIMDEPTAALNDAEVETLFQVIEQFITPTTGVIYVSHRMEEIMRIADRITVLRDGEFIGTMQASQTSIDDIIQQMVGRKIVTDIRPVAAVAKRPALLEVEGLSTTRLLQNVSFELRRGEILGFAGLMGAGRTEVARAIVGADPKSAGTVRIDGVEANIKSPADAVRLGIGYMSEDRKQYGLLLDHDITGNINLATLDRRANRFGFIQDKPLRAVARDYVKSLGIKTPSIDQLTQNLSGGNQQKVVLAKWLARDCDILIIDEPTRGIDVGAKDEIYNLLGRLVAAGKSLIVISSEIGEVMRLSDRIVVMCDGRATGVLENADATQEKIMELATQFNQHLTEEEK